MTEDYYDRVWTKKLSLPQYADLRSRWRTRWDFAVDAIDDGSKVLDAACGDGVLGERLIVQKGCRVVGLEISGYARARARERGIEVERCDISSERFPVPDAGFDAVTLLCCLEHIFDPGHALREAARAVKPGGKVLVTLPNAVQLKFRLAFLLGRLSKDLPHTNDARACTSASFTTAATSPPSPPKRCLSSPSSGSLPCSRIPTSTAR